MNNLDAPILSPYLRELSESAKLKELKTAFHLEPPTTRSELLARLKGIVGRSIGELAAIADVPLPYSMAGAKGFAGQLIELFLGANATNLPLPDFVNLGIELKTMPVNLKLKPQGSTYVCNVDLMPERYVSFERSHLYGKLKEVLFVLLYAPKGLALHHRLVIGYCFYTPTKEDLNIFRIDYEELMEMVLSGEIGKLDASLGTYLQIRAKGLLVNELTTISGEQGEGQAQALALGPRAFYLRASFTRTILTRFFGTLELPQSMQDRLSALTQERPADHPSPKASDAGDDDNTLDDKLAFDDLDEL